MRNTATPMAQRPRTHKATLTAIPIVAPVESPELDVVILEGVLVFVGNDPDELGFAVGVAVAALANLYPLIGMAYIIPPKLFTVKVEGCVGSEVAFK
jgi:hypothetical protein